MLWESASGVANAASLLVGWGSRRASGGCSFCLQGGPFMVAGRPSELGFVQALAPTHLATFARGLHGGCRLSIATRLSPRG